MMYKKRSLPFHEKPNSQLLLQYKNIKTRVKSSVFKNLLETMSSQNKLTHHKKKVKLNLEVVYNELIYSAFKMK